MTAAFEASTAIVTRASGGMGAEITARLFTAERHGADLIL